MRFELTTVSLATRGSTTELHSHPWWRNHMYRCSVGKWILVLEVVNDHAITAGLEDLFHKCHMQGVRLISILRDFVFKNKIQRNLIGLIDHVPMAAGHFAAVIVQHAGTGLEVFFSAGKKLCGGVGDIGLGPENNYV